MAVIRFADFELDLHSYELHERGDPRKLQLQPAKVLALLAMNPGRLVTREEIRKNLWGDDTFVDFEQSLNFCIRRIRAVLGDDAEQPRFIETLPRRGYRFMACVSRISEEELPSVRRPIRLAVIPLEEFGTGAKQDYFGAGLAEEVVSILSRLNPEQLRVVSTRIRGARQHARMDLPRLRRELNIDYALTGSVRRSDGRIRIAVQLLDLSDGGLLRSETYEREAKDLFTVQEELAKQIAQWFAIELVPSTTLVQQKHVPTPAAHDAYLKARFFWHKMTGESIRLSMRYFQEATAADPHFAAPYAGLADCYAQMGSLRVALMKPSEALANAQPLLRRALELNESLAEAHCTLGMLKSWYELDWRGAGAEFQRALQGDANNITALIWYALYLSAIGQPQDALRTITRARELDPLSAVVNTYVGVIYLHLGQLDFALRQLLQAIEFDPYYYRLHMFLGKVFSRLGRRSEAIESYKKALQRNPESLEALAFLACEFAMAGQRGSALELLHKVRATEDYFEPSLLCAAICSALGDANEAFGWLERALQNQAGPLYLVRIDDAFRSLRSDPRYRWFLERIGLPPAS